MGELKNYFAHHALDFGILLLFIRYMVLITFASGLVLEDFRRKGLCEENISCLYRSAFSGSQAEVASLQAKHGDEINRHS